MVELLSNAPLQCREALEGNFSWSDPLPQVCQVILEQAWYQDGFEQKGELALYKELTAPLSAAAQDKMGAARAWLLKVGFMAEFRAALAQPLQKIQGSAKNNYTQLLWNFKIFLSYSNWSQFSQANSVLGREGINHLLVGRLQSLQESLYPQGSLQTLGEGNFALITYPGAMPILISQADLKKSVEEALRSEALSPQLKEPSPPQTVPTGESWDPLMWPADC